MEEFKALHELMQADERNHAFTVMDMKTNKTEQLSVEYVHQQIAEIILNPSVPEEVISQFNVARNLAVYSWFSYSFHQVAEMKAFSTMERALKIKLNVEKGSFSKLLENAVSKGLIKDEGFSHITPVDNDRAHYSRILAKVAPHLRNDLAHGSKTLYPGSQSTLRIAADFINQLFPENL